MASASPTPDHLFAWSGLDENGRPCSGRLEAGSPQQARHRLRRQHIIPRRVQRLPPPGSGISPQAITRFTEQLALLLRAGIPLLEALQATASGKRDTLLAALVERLIRDITHGSSLADAMGRYPRHFDSLYCNMVACGEHTGHLDSQLQRLADLREKHRQLRLKVRRALAYPLVVLVVATLVCGLLLTQVVPQFAALFASQQAQLPALTRLVLSLSDTLRQQAIPLMAALLILACGLRLLLYQPGARRWLQQVLARLPLLGPLQQQAAVARIARTLSITLAAGLPLIEAIGWLAEASTSYRMNQAMGIIRQHLAAGDNLHQAMEASQVFPDLALHLVRLGETSGSLEQMLENVARYHEEQVDTQLERLTRLLEPAIMSIIGLLVGGLVIAMYLPVFQIGSVF